MMLRSYNSADTEALADLFTDTIHAINIRDYSAAQVAAWAPRPYDIQFWRERFARMQPIVVEMDDQPVGFCELETDGHIGCFYVHKDFQLKGIGTLMYKEIERKSAANGFTRLYSEVSITALPFFQKCGFNILALQEVTVRGEAMKNFRMEKKLGKML
jgi:GNAT superfamily N-acetyltransferase